MAVTARLTDKDGVWATADLSAAHVKILMLALAEYLSMLDNEMLSATGGELGELRRARGHALGTKAWMRQVEMECNRVEKNARGV
jgi:hypothetical protein